MLLIHAIFSFVDVGAEKGLMADRRPWPHSARCRKPLPRTLAV
jgi:hypothetical protein